MKKKTTIAAWRALAIIMALLMALVGPLGHVALAQGADAAGGAYLSEVRVGVAGTAEEAARALEADGWAVLRADGRPADLNQGAGAALKSDRAVVLGYKTTGEAARALTDLAVMNMSGGYSFSDYEQLMDRYRDGQVRPFIERFMATVAEYRANAASESPGNRARAAMACALLNRIVEDDTGGRLGDLLLERTRAEMGAEYDALSEDEAKRHIDLETALMQGDSATVAQAERLLALAADSGGETWLERLSALGPDGLEARMGDARPADVQAELDSRYQDIARRLADGWEDVRAALLAQSPKSAPQAGAEGSGQAPTELGGEASAQQDGVAVEGSDEQDISALILLDTTELPEEVDDGDVRIEDAPEVISSVSETMGDMADSSAAVANTRDAAIAAFLAAKPYGDGTLYDLFTRPLADLTGENIAMLYPAASCLSEGQVAAMDFLSLTDLLQVGATTGNSLAQVWTEDTRLAQMVVAAPEVSLYQGVDRGIFSDKVALTSDALRADALRSQDSGVVDFLSTYRRTALLWFVTAMTGIAAGFSSYMELGSVAKIHQEANEIYGRWKTFTDRLDETQKSFNSMKDKLLNNKNYNGLEWVKVTKTGEHNYAISMKAKMKADVKDFYERYTDEVKKLDRKLSLEANYPSRNKDVLKRDKYQRLIDQVDNDSIVSQNVSDDTLELITNNKKYGSIDECMDDMTTNATKILDDTDAEMSGVRSKMNNSSGWTTISTIAGVAFFLLTLASIASTAYDVYSYYNVDYAPVPGYIVDVSDITSTAPDGTTTVVRNDRAYYRAATTDAERDGKDLAAMSDYADLNGGAGKEWLALYAASRPGQGPILADSLKVVVGTSSVPDGYSDGIHMFGSGSAANLTDARYCYNDDAGGVYAYFRRDAAAAPAAASALSGGSAALVGGLCLAAGAGLGAGATALAFRRRREPAAA